MVVESFISAATAEKRPWILFWIGFGYTSLAILGAWKIFSGQAGMVIVFLTVLACSHLMYVTIRNEEEKDLAYPGKNLLERHGRTFLFLMMLFLGISLCIAFWYVVLPSDVSSSLFETQISTLQMIKNKAIGGFLTDLRINRAFSGIFLNNITVLAWCIIAGLIYGLGAIFILVWNASVIGVAVGNFFKDKMAIYAGAMGFHKLAGYLHVASWSIMRYFFHGFWEILAYFLGGLAGGLISMALVRHRFNIKKIEVVLLDASNLIILAIFILLFAAALEVFLTPRIFL